MAVLLAELVEALVAQLSLPADLALKAQLLDLVDLVALKALLLDRADLAALVVQLLVLADQVVLVAAVPVEVAPVEQLLSRQSFSAAMARSTP